MASELADYIPLRQLGNIEIRFRRSEQHPLERLGLIAWLGVMTIGLVLLVGVGLHALAGAPQIALDDSALECRMARHLSEAIAAHKSMRPSIGDPFGVGVTSGDSIGWSSCDTSDLSQRGLY